MRQATRLQNSGKQQNGTEQKVGQIPSEDLQLKFPFLIQLNVFYLLNSFLSSNNFTVKYVILRPSHENVLHIFYVLISLLAGKRIFSILRKTLAWMWIMWEIKFVGNDSLLFSSNIKNLLITGKHEGVESDTKNTAKLKIPSSEVLYIWAKPKVHR